MELVVNGQTQNLPDRPISLAELLSYRGVTAETTGVAIAVNETVVRKADWPNTPLNEGDRIEVVTARQGG